MNLNHQIILFLGLICFTTLDSLAQNETIALEKNQKIVFQNVNLLTMNNDQIITDQTVIIEDDIIKTIGNKDNIEIPEGFKIIDAKNAFLLPGLMDMHVHVFSEDELLLYLINGVTTIRNLWGWEAHLKMKNDVESGMLIGPTIYTSGRIVDGKPAKLRGSAEIDNFLKAREEVKTQAIKGYDFIKVYDRIESDKYSAVILEARKYNIPVVGHVPKNVGLYSALLAGQNSIEHLNSFLAVSSYDSIPSWSSHLDISLLTYNASLAKDFNTWITPTLIVQERGDMSAAESKMFLERPELKYLPPFYKRFCCGAPNDIEDDLLINEKNLRHSNRLLVLNTLHNNGVNLLLGTDTGNKFVLPGYDIHSELELLVQSGLSPFEALKTGTINPATYLGKLAEVGTIEEGKIADLILVKENPLINLKTLQKPLGIVTRGKWFSKKDIQKLLNKLEAKQK